MEEEIKILEEQLKAYKRHIKNYEEDRCLTSTYYQLKEYANALENLIKRNKELEETKNKLVRYIAVKERKDFEQVCKEFEI